MSPTGLPIESRRASPIERGEPPHRMRTAMNDIANRPRWIGTRTSGMGARLP